MILDSQGMPKLMWIKEKNAYALIMDWITRESLEDMLEYMNTPQSRQYMTWSDQLSLSRAEIELVIKGI